MMAKHAQLICNFVLFTTPLAWFGNGMDPQFTKQQASEKQNSDGTEVALVGYTSCST